MLLFASFCYYCIDILFHDLTKLDLAEMLTSVDGMTWYLELIHKLSGDI